MRVRVRTVIFSVLALLVVLVLVVITKMGWQVVLGPHSRPVTNRKFEVTQARLDRGKYLVESQTHCFFCHSEHTLTDPMFPMVAGKMGAGFELPIPELGRVIAPNITPDPETGIGKWTDDEIARAMQEGVSRDGRALFPIMPYQRFRNLTDEDLASVIVYVRSVPPVRNVLPVTKLNFPLNFIVKTIPEPLTTHTPQPPRTTAEARGEYIVEAAVGCADCHTPTNQGVPLPGLTFGGGESFDDPSQRKTVFSANITMDPSGIAHYDETMFINTMRTGQVPGRVLTHIMPFEAFKNMTDDDLKDVFAYLKTRPPVKHRVSNVDPPTLCVVCNKTHGLGELNRKAGQ
ncbi:MAG TPA: cytochrome c [Vicinamibacterales bacterium]|nr:cytochrome c [Vicinamibacterales bacterium]